MNRYQWTDRKPGTPVPQVTGGDHARVKSGREERRMRDRDIAEGKIDIENYNR